MEIDQEKIEEVQTRLLAWFAANGRDLPWRRTRDPYRILVSEVMLQQTQVDRVIPYYLAFLERFPDVGSLAGASVGEVIKAWGGLGYNRRAVNLHRTARHIVEEHGGMFPREVARLQALPGIGPYTAGAIACFAFEQDVAFIDTNMRRLLHRLFVGVEIPKPRANDATVTWIAAAALPRGEGWAWNQALIEFGALQCTARRPACVVCPLQDGCLAYPAIQLAIAALPRTKRAEPTLAYDGSQRFYRGRVIAALRDLPASDERQGIDLRSLGERVRPGFSDDDLPWLRDLVRGLSRDGLAVAAEESPRYDADDESSPDRVVRIRLPS